MIIIVAIILGIIILDGWIKRNIRINDDKAVKKGSSCSSDQKPLIQITHLENSGAAGGRGSKHPKRLLATSGILLLAIAGLLTGGEKVPSVFHVEGVYSKIGLAFILGGGISNWLDRAKQGTVTDYLKFPRFPIKRIAHLVFNISDFCIFFGAIVYAISSFIRSS